MRILGIYDGHNATTALCVNGEITNCISEERLTRLKNDGGSPLKSIELLNKDIDYAAISAEDAGDPILTEIKRETLFSIKDYIREQHEYWKPLLYENRKTDFHKRFPKVQEFNRQYHPNQKFIDHHVCHAYYAYYASPPSERAVIVTADSWGDGCNASISIVEDSIREIFRTPMCNLARIYRWITLLLGMRPLEHEYKVMGLAPYSKEYLTKQAYNVFKETLAVDGIDFKWYVKPTDMYFYFKDKLEGIRFDGIAGGLQKWLEEMLSEWITNIMKYTQTDILYYSGGLSMNVKANGVIAKLPCIKKLYVPPSGADESTAIGAAYKLAVELGDKPKQIKNYYLA